MGTRVRAPMMAWRTPACPKAGSTRYPPGDPMNQDLILWPLVAQVILVVLLTQLLNCAERLIRKLVEAKRGRLYSLSAALSGQRLCG